LFALAKTTDSVKTKLRSSQGCLNSEIFIRIRWRSFFQILLGTSLGCFSSIDIDLIDVLANVSKHGNEVRADLKNATGDCEDGLLAPITST
jgi:hypothetical protein